MPSLWFGALPIRHKLIVIIVGSCAVALLVAVLLTTIFNWYSVRQQQIDKLLVTAQIIALQSKAPLEFIDAKAARENLASLTLEPSIRLACIYDEEHRLFAAYTEAKDSDTAERAACPPPAPHEMNFFHRGSLAVYRDIDATERRLGGLYLELDLTKAYEEMLKAIVYTLLIFAATIVLVLPVSNYVQRRISMPVVQLAEMTRRFSIDRSAPVEKINVGNDELGELVQSFHGMMNDIRRNERRLEQAVAELSRSNTELERFAYICSHDLQEPLRMVSNYTAMLERRLKGQLDADTQTYMHYITDGAARMRELVSDILAYSRIGTQSESMQEIDMAALVAYVLQNLKATIDEKKATIHVGEMPRIAGHRTLLAQVLQNLLSNAIKFCRDRPPEVWIDAERQETGWLFRIKDNGIGIDLRYRDKVFEIFKRLNRREEFQGTGIGLAICKKAVEHHGGRIWIDSLTGEGTTFLFTLPDKTTYTTEEREKNEESRYPAGRG